MMGFMVWDVNSTNIGALTFSPLLIAHSLSLEVMITANHAACTRLCQGRQVEGMNLNWCMTGYEEGKRLKNITSWMLSNTIQDSMPQFGLVPTYQNASVSPRCQPAVKPKPLFDALQIMILHSGSAACAFALLCSAAAWYHEQAEMPSYV